MSEQMNAEPSRRVMRMRAVSRRLAGRDPVPLAIAAGLAVAVIALTWLSVLLLSGPGASERVLLPILLLVLPLLGGGAAVGWLAGLGLRALAQRSGLDRG